VIHSVLNFCFEQANESPIRHPSIAGRGIREHPHTPVGPCKVNPTVHLHA